MDYNKIFENDIETKFFYTDYPGKKIVVGRTNLHNAKARLSKDEYYTLVTYSEGEQLPEQYIPLNGLESDDDTLFATFNPNNRYAYICMNGGIQMISRLPNLDDGSIRYLLGPGPEIVILGDLILVQHNEYLSSKNPEVAGGRK